MRCRLVVLSMSVGMSILGSAGLSQADPAGPNALPVSVVTVRTDDADDQAEALTQALKAEVRKLRGWSLGEGDFALEVLSLALKCPTPPDAACELRVADQIKADRFVWGSIKRAPGHRVTGTLHMWTRKQGETKTDVSFSDNMTEANDDSLRKVVQDALAALTGGPPKGTVAISAADVTGQVYVDGQPSGSIRDGNATIVVPVGSHKVEVRAPGYAPVSGEVSVRPNQSVSLSLTPMTDEQARRAGTPTNWNKVGGYTSLGVGVVLLGVGAYSGVKMLGIANDPGFQDYKDGVGSGGNACEYADAGHDVRTQPNNAVPTASSPSDVSSMCKSAKTYATMQWVMYPLGAVFAGAGLYLLLTDKKGEASPAPTTGKVHLLPSVFPGRGGGGSLDVVVAF